MGLYERIKSLCEQRGITVGRMCDSIGLSKGAMTDLKMGRKKTIRADTAAKIASFLDVSVDTLLGAGERDAVILGYHREGPIHLGSQDQEERQLLELFHQLSGVQRRQLIEMAKILLGDIQS